MSRSIWKNLNRISFINKKNIDKIINIRDRSSKIPFSLVNKKVFIYDGKIFKPCYITPEKVGFKFGEFIFTRKNKPKIVVKKIKKKIK